MYGDLFIVPTLSSVRVYTQVYPAVTFQFEFRADMQMNAFMIPRLLDYSTKTYVVPSPDGFPCYEIRGGFLDGMHVVDIRFRDSSQGGHSCGCAYVSIVEVRVGVGRTTLSYTFFVNAIELSMYYLVGV